MLLLPLNRRRRFAGNIEDHSGYCSYFSDDSVRYPLDKFVWQMGPTSRHKVDSFYCGRYNDQLIAPSIAHHAHRLHRQAYRKGLRYPSVEVCVTQFFDKNSDSFPSTSA